MTTVASVASESATTLPATTTGGESSGSTGGEPVCGDGTLDEGEDCDDGEDNGPGQACKADCTPSTCGDGDAGPLEECDNGAMNGDMNACKSDCTNNTCGDGFPGPGEGGFSCPLGGYGSNLGPLPEYGVAVNVWYQQTSILANHGPGNVIGSATCTNP